MNQPWKHGYILVMCLVISKFAPLYCERSNVDDFDLTIASGNDSLKLANGGNTNFKTSSDRRSNRRHPHGVTDRKHGKHRGTTDSTIHGGRGHLSQLDSMQSTNTSVILSGHVPVQNEVLLRRELRQKRRKLKRLWQEIDRIQHALKSASKSDSVDRLRQIESDFGDGKSKSKLKNKKNQWRRRMMQRLKMMSRQLQEQQRSASQDTIEKLYALLSVDLTEGERQHSSRRKGERRRTKTHHGRHRNSNSSTITGRSNVTLSSSGVINNLNASSQRGRVEIGRKRQNSTSGNGTSANASSVARAVIKKGEAGSTCTSHKNCKPGFCCHQSTLAKPSSVANVNVSVCVDHRLKQSQPCVNSCQCDSGLQCFVSRKDKLYHKRVAPLDSSSAWALQQQDEGLINKDGVVSTGDGQCKIPAMDDVLHGTYIIGDTGVFKATP